MSSVEAPSVVESAFDVQRIRRDFPILTRSIREQNLVYLDSAATTQKPQPVLDTLANYYATGNANIHRGVYLLSEEATAAYDRARYVMFAYPTLCLSSPCLPTSVSPPIPQPH